MQFKETLSKLSFAKLLNFLGLTGGSACKKTSSGSTIKKFGNVPSDGASGSRKLKRKVDEISSNKSSRLEVDRNTFKVPKLAPAKLLSSKTDSNLKGKNNVKGKETSILNCATLSNI